MLKIFLECIMEHLQGPEVLKPLTGLLLSKPNSTISEGKIKKVNEKVYAAQLEGQYRAAGQGFYQRNNGNSSYHARRETMEEFLSKFITKSAKRHGENTNIIKEIRSSTDAAIRNQGALIKTLELKIGQMSKVLQERGFGSLPSSTEINPKDQFEIGFSTVQLDLLRYAVWKTSQSSYRYQTQIHFPETVPSKHLYYCDDLEEAHEVKDSGCIDHKPASERKIRGFYSLLYE
ncbi:hypothetical protein Tco_0311920 [Tanacetum coccineum]